MDHAERIAKKLYVKYANAVGGIAYNGDPLPTWEEFVNDEKKAKQVEGWIAVASEAMTLGASDCTCS